MKPVSKELNKWFNKHDKLSKTKFVKLDRQVWDYDNNTLKNYYNIKKSTFGIEVEINLNTNKITAVRICDYYKTTKELRKSGKL